MFVGQECNSYLKVWHDKTGESGNETSFRDIKYIQISLLIEEQQYITLIDSLP